MWHVLVLISQPKSVLSAVRRARSVSASLMFGLAYRPIGKEAIYFLHMARSSSHLRRWRLGEFWKQKKSFIFNSATLLVSQRKQGSVHSFLPKVNIAPLIKAYDRCAGMMLCVELNNIHRCI